MTDETGPAPFAVAAEDFCRMCGFDQDRFWEDGSPTYAICDCCGSESGIGDLGAVPGSWEGVRGLHDFRGWWVGQGAEWSTPSQRPADWDLLRQMRNIPSEWRSPSPPTVDRAQRAALQESCGALDGEESICRVCGFLGEIFWSNGEPTGVTCPCCGSESGVDDLGRPGDWNSMTLIRTSRGYWIANGAQWVNPELRPAGWTVLRQISEIPVDWR
ncbi:hypothetical protein [Streptomyces sp. NPDC006552]|uniref:hypothetical protein n=1 Tax=Streptomyces sp. NPDC006552 TaxID=3157179 RepID=UPI0033AAE855